MKAEDGERSPASISFVPPVAGLILAGEVIKDLIAEQLKQRSSTKKEKINEKDYYHRWTYKRIYR